jgi:DNA-binding transcriptional regulator YiaG
LPQTTKQNLLVMAAERIGREELARRLNVPDSLLTAWMSGHAAMPDRKLLALASLIEELGDKKSA